MIVWSYFATVLTDAGSVPENWHPFVDDAVSVHLLSMGIV